MVAMLIFHLQWQAPTTPSQQLLQATILALCRWRDTQARAGTQRHIVYHQDTSLQTLPLCTLSQSEVSQVNCDNSVLHRHLFCRLAAPS